MSGKRTLVLNSRNKNTAAAAVADFELGVVVLHDKHMLASTHNE